MFCTVYVGGERRIRLTPPGQGRACPLDDGLDTR